MKLHLVAIDPPGGSNSALHVDLVRRLAAQAEGGTRHTLTDTPAEADRILFVEPEPAEQYARLRAHPLLKEFPHKCLCYSEYDRPIPFLPGIYPSIPRRLHRPGRTAGFCYVSRLAHSGNPYVRYDPQPAEKRYLATFLGQPSAPVRERLFQAAYGRDDLLIEDTSRAYDHWKSDQRPPDPVAKEAAQRRYAELCRQSKFILCPRGWGASTVRLFEVMELGVAPVILADAWVEPRGPEWDAFSLRVPEDALARLPQLLAERETRHAEMGQAARRAWETWFAPGRQFNRLVDELETLRVGARPALWPLRISYEETRALALRSIGFLARRSARVFGSSR